MSTRLKVKKCININNQGNELEGADNEAVTRAGDRWSLWGWLPRRDRMARLQSSGLDSSVLHGCEIAFFVARR